MHLGPDDVLVAAKLEFSVRHDAGARARDRHRRSARASLGADRDAHLRRARHVPKPDRARRRPEVTVMADDSDGDDRSGRHVQRGVQPSRRRRGDGGDDRRLRVREHVAAVRRAPRGAGCGARRMGGASSRSTPTAHFDAEDVIATGDRCVVQWRFTWKNDDGDRGRRPRRRRDPRARRQGRREVRLREGLRRSRGGGARRGSAPRSPRRCPTMR